jgi:hypothetical protein
MLRWGLSILGIGLLLLLILESSGGLGSCGPRPGMMPILLAYMLALPIGGLLTMIGLIQLAIDRFRHRHENGSMPRITP